MGCNQCTYIWTNFQNVSICNHRFTNQNKQEFHQYGKQDLFAVVIALRYLISNEDFKAFKSGLEKLINKVLKQCPHLTQEQLLKEMGFPVNWERIMRYKK